MPPQPIASLATPARALRPSAGLVLVAALVASVCLACGTDGDDRSGGVERVDVRDDYVTEVWADGLDTPSAITLLGDGGALVTEKGGFETISEGRLVHVRPDGTTEVLLTLPVCADFERGLVGVAATPDVPTNGWVYLYRTMDPEGGCATDPSPFDQRTGTTVNRLSRFTMVDGRIDPASEEVVIGGLRGDNLAHQGGGLAFGPDGALYVAVGSASQDDDPTTPSPDSRSREGSILRTTGDPAAPVPDDNPSLGPDAHPLVFAIGFRNPFRIAVDPTDGMVIAGDVGLGSAEELDVVVPGGDYGWPRWEGDVLGPFPGDGAADDPALAPLFSYTHDDGCTAVLAGGFLPPDPQDTLVKRIAFADFGCGSVWILTVRAGVAATLAEVARIPTPLSDLAVAPDGTLLALVLDGQVVRIRPRTG